MIHSQLWVYLLSDSYFVLCVGQYTTSSSARHPKSCLSRTRQSVRDNEFTFRSGNFRSINCRYSRLTNLIRNTLYHECEKNIVYRLRMIVSLIEINFDLWQKGELSLFQTALPTSLPLQGDTSTNSKHMTMIFLIYKSDFWISNFKSFVLIKWYFPEFF